MSALLLILAASGGFIIEHATVYVGDGTVREDTTVVVDGGKIVSVGPSVRSDLRRIDGMGKVITPGFVEAVSQVGLLEVMQEKTTNDHNFAGHKVSPAFRAADGFQPHSVRIPNAREEGVTSLVSAPTGGLIAGQASWADMTGTLASIPNGDKPVAIFASLKDGSHAFGNARGGAWLRLREIVHDTRTYIKNRTAYERGEMQLSMSGIHLAAMVPVVAGKLPLAVEADRASDLLALAHFSKKEKIGVIIIGGAESWLVAKQLKAAKITVVLQPTTQQPNSFNEIRARDDLPALLDDAGVSFVITAAGWDQNARRLRQEAGIAVARGLPAQRALRAITMTPARIYGRMDVGSIEKGMRANLVVWSGDPFEFSSVAEHVFIDGVEQDLDTRQKALARKYLTK